MSPVIKVLSEIDDAESFATVREEGCCWPRKKFGADYIHTAR